MNFSKASAARFALQLQADEEARAQMEARAPMRMCVGSEFDHETLNRSRSRAVQLEGEWRVSVEAKLLSSMQLAERQQYELQAQDAEDLPALARRVMRGYFFEELLGQNLAAEVAEGRRMEQDSFIIIPFYMHPIFLELVLTMCRRSWKSSRGVWQLALLLNHSAATCVRKLMLG